MFIRFENDRHIVTFHTSPDGKTWTKFDTQMEVSGYHHNTAYDFLSLRPGLYAAGEGKVRFRNFKYPPSEMGTPPHIPSKKGRT